MSKYNNKNKSEEKAGALTCEKIIKLHLFDERERKVGVVADSKQ